MAGGPDNNLLFDELDRREADGIEVALLWNRRDNALAVVVLDTKTDETFELAVPPDKALDVFHHPFAHAAFQGVWGDSEPVAA